uniref:Uncharacterized protein n=1 Tax=Parascaris univalens TaxID=6257 RepID=A0A915AHQ6_PARUN
FDCWQRLANSFIMSYELYLKLTFACLVFNLVIVSVFYKFSPEGTSFPQLLIKMMFPLCIWEMLVIFVEYPDDMLDWLSIDLT